MSRDNRAQTNMELISNCCGSNVYEDNDICAECEEHCSAVDVDSDEEYVFFINEWIKK